MHQAALTFHRVSYGYPGSPEPALRDISFSIGTGWTAIAGANGCGKSTLLKLATGFLTPDNGSVAIPGKALYCPQRTDNPPDGFEEFVQSWLFPDLMTRLGIGWDWPGRWNTLSHGERKRAQLALALGDAPDILAVDEPVNHLDARARELVGAALAGFDGIGLLVSHDRQLMDTLATRCGILYPEGLVIRRGGYTVARREDSREQEALRERRRVAGEKYRQLARNARRRQLTSMTLQARSSGRRLTFREICLTGADGPSRVDSSVQKAGQLATTARCRAKRAKEEMESITYRKTHRSGIEIPGEECHRSYLADLPEGVVQAGVFRLHHPPLVVRRGDRIALTGPNGSGKSTLLRFLVERLDLPEGRLLYIPQELTRGESAAALARAKALGTEALGRVMACVRRLGSSPEPLLGSAVPSPGETRKLLLCLGLLDNPWFLIMDEPTNHLDLPGIECLEEALSDLRSGLLLVSHDRRFLSSTTSVEWRVALDGGTGVLKTAT
jgi:ATPase subunit of ABC transporter with duplicated ATPase domains